MRKLIWIIIIILVLFLLALWSPWTNWSINFSGLLGVTPPDEVGSLKVSSLAGELEVFIDDMTKSVSLVSPSNSPATIPGIPPGDHLIKLKRRSEVEGAFWEFSQLIKFLPGIDVTMAYELGPSESFSEGHIIFAHTRNDGRDDVFLNVEAAQEDVTVYVDGVKVSEAPIINHKLTINSQHKITLEKEGHETQEFLLLPEEQEERNRLKGFDVNVEATLFLQPIYVRQSTE